MTSARREVFDPSAVGVYHCMLRCVRRAFLCGNDHYTGKSYEHRKQWARNRLSTLSRIFAIDIISYAIMSNHLHALLKNRPDTAAKWSPEEVARRWRQLFPRRWMHGQPAEPNEFEISTITDDPSLVETYRRRLSSISWFQRCFAEHLARRANKEDDCKGRFWEGRFKCQRVHGVGALISCSTYIDLNPIRAHIAASPETSNFTSIQDRIRSLKQTVTKDPSSPSNPPLVPIEEATGGAITLSQYLTIVDSTGRALKEGKGRIEPELEDILTRLRVSPTRWLDTTTKFRERFRRALGPVEALEVAAKSVGKHWFQGLGACRKAFT